MAKPGRPALSWRRFEPWRAPQAVHHGLTLLLAAGPAWGLWLLIHPASLELGRGAALGAAVTAASLWQSWAGRTRLPSYHALWFLSVSFLVLFGVLGLPPWPVPLAIVAAQALALAVQGTFQGRAWWFGLSRGLSEGEALRLKMREYGADAEFSPKNARWLTVLTLGPGLALTALWLWGPEAPSSPLRELGAALLLAAQAVLLSLWRLYREEMRLFTRGLHLGLGAKAGRLGAAGLLGLAAALGAWALSPAWTPAMFDRLWSPAPEAAAPLSPGSSPAPSAEPSLIDPGLRRPAPEQPPYLLDLFNLRGWFLLLGLIYQALRWLWPLGLAALLAAPVWLWLRGGGRFSWRGGPRAWALRLWAQWRRWWASWRGRAETGTDLNPALWAALPNSRRWLAGLAPQVRIRVLRAGPLERFLRVLDWAGARGLAYERGQTSAEFLRALGARWPERAPASREWSHLLDRWWFSGRPWSPAEKRRAETLFRRILDGRPQSQDNTPHDHRTQNPQ